MTPQFHLAQPAIEDIEQIADYIARESGLDRADRFLSNLDAKFAKIAQFPTLDDKETKFYPCFAVSPQTTISSSYMPIGQNVEIFRVISGYRDLSALFDDADD